MLPIYEVTIFNKFGQINERKLFRGYKAAHAFEKTIKKANEDPARASAMILYKFTEQKDGSFKEIYIGPSNW